MFSWLPSISRCWVSKSNLTFMLISFLRFAKNIDPSQISLKFLKGEGELTNLELDEAVLSDLLEFPPWLQLTKVTCNRISAKVTLYFWFWPHKKGGWAGWRIVIISLVHICWSVRRNFCYYIIPEGFLQSLQKMTFWWTMLFS